MLNSQRNGMTIRTASTAITARMARSAQRDADLVCIATVQYLTQRREAKNWTVVMARMTRVRITDTEAA